MTSETKLHLAEKFRQNWQSQYPYLGKTENRQPQHNILKHINRNVISNMSEFSSQNLAIIDDSLTNLNWLQNLNLFSMSPCQPPLSPAPVSYFHSTSQQIAPIVSSANISNRFVHPFFESNSLYAEVAHNLEFMNEEASAHFFKINNQLRPPFSDINLISMAIYSYNKQKVSFPEICQWIEDTFPYYKIINQDWKVGIKNNLTLSKCFQKVPRRKDEVEKGGFWRFSNDFLSYLEKNRLIERNLSNIVKNVQQENANQIEYRYGRCMPRKRAMCSMVAHDENDDITFKSPNKRAYLNNDHDHIVCRPGSFDMGNSFLLKSEASTHHYHNSPQSNLALSGFNNDIFGDVSLLTSTANTSQLSQLFEQNKFENNTFQDNLDSMQIPLVIQMGNNNNDNNLNTYPEQVTEEEFLSGRLFSNGYLTSQSNLGNLPTLLDSQVNFGNSDFNIHDLSITGIGIRAPEWWNQSLSASQISISKLGCSVRSLASVGNIERGSPFVDDDHHIVWHNDQNLEELDIMFGLT